MQKKSNIQFNAYMSAGGTFLNVFKSPGLLPMVVEIDHFATAIDRILYKQNDQLINASHKYTA